MVYPVCVGCKSGIRHGQKFKVGEGFSKLFWSVRQLDRVNSNDYICQKCQLKFVHWTKETNDEFKNLIKNEQEREKSNLDGNVRGFVYCI